MTSIADKLTAVTQRIADSEQRIVEQQKRISNGGCNEAADGAIMLYMGGEHVKRAAGLQGAA